MSKYLLLLACSLTLLGGSAKADEQSRTDSTEVKTPDYNANSSTSTTTRTENVPATVKQESSYSESSPGSEKHITSTRKYTVPIKQQHTVTKHTETEVAK